MPEGVGPMLGVVLVLELSTNSKNSALDSSSDGDVIGWLMPVIFLLADTAALSMTGTGTGRIFSSTADGAVSL